MTPSAAYAAGVAAGDWQADPAQQAVLPELDYLVLLILLLAIGGRPFTRWVKALIAFGIVVNLFGAITFDRIP